MGKVTLRRFFTSSLLGLAFSLLVSAQESEKLPQLRLSFDLEALNYDSYIPGKAVVTDENGAVTELYATFKTRGSTARSYPMKPAMNMKLVDEAGEEFDYNLLGLREASSFILDAMAIDRINMRNRVCYDIWNNFSRLPYETDFGSRNGTVGKFVEVWINDGYKGIYCVTDKINRKLLGLKKPKTDDNDNLKEIRGVLYKHGTSDIENQNDVGMYNDWIIYVMQWHDVWELHEPDAYACEAAWEPLLDLYRNNNFADYDYVKRHFYLENLADFAVHLMALSISDNWGTKNKYFSIVNIQDETRFVVTPWDLDTSLGGEYDGSKFGGDYVVWTLQEIVNNAPIPFATVMNKPEFETLMKQAWKRGRTGAFAVDSVCQRLDDYCSLFVNSGAWQRTVDYWTGKQYTEMYVDDLPTEINYIKDWYRNRYAEMDQFFGTSDDNRDAVADIEADDTDAPCRYYNLQGVRIPKPATPGLYIRRTPTAATKVLVR